MIYSLCRLKHTLVPSADLCMGWVPPGDFGHPGTAAAPRAAHVWGAPAGRPERPDSFWRWCSTPRSYTGVTLRVNRTWQSSQPWCLRGKNDKNKEWITSSTDDMHSFHSWLTCHSFGRTGYFSLFFWLFVCFCFSNWKILLKYWYIFLFSSHPDFKFKFMEIHSGP